MSLFKKRITEKEVTALFIHGIFETSEKNWEAIHNDFSNTFKDYFVVNDKNMFAFHLSLAAVSLEMQALVNLFPNDQAERLKSWIFELLSQEPEWGGFAANEIARYNEAFNSDLKNLGGTIVPMSAIPLRLLSKWLDNDEQNFDKQLKFNGVLLQTTAKMLVFGFGGRWKKIKENYKIVENY